ncbi:MAG: hypothetical protein JSW00_13570 [Thermoplasmata archaeon]|nr:MAG: hypothetical protein JSW00_13570 [Thermoplasmata archaeon]
MDVQTKILNEFNTKYDEIKEKVADINKLFLELTNQHMTLNESFYIVKKDLNLLHNEMDSIRKFRDQLKRELGIVD